MRRQPATISAGCVPTTWLVPALTVIGRSVVVRSVRQGTCTYAKRGESRAARQSLQQALNLKPSFDGPRHAADVLRELPH